jgi:hypothetical protein
MQACLNIVAGIDEGIVQAQQSQVKLGDNEILIVCGVADDGPLAARVTVGVEE